MCQLLCFRGTKFLSSFFNFRFDAVEILSHLRYLNLAHNFIKSIDGLEQNSALVELNLSMNEITDIAAMPSLVNLTVLHLNNNKVSMIVLEVWSQPPRL